jgi:hypothetical protein
MLRSLPASESATISVTILLPFDVQRELWYTGVAFAITTILAVFNHISRMRYRSMRLQQGVCKALPRINRFPEAGLSLSTGIVIRLAR